MAKQIALNLTINGVKQSITNINQLETAIKDAQEELKGLDIGSEQFKKLSSEIKNAKNIAEDFQESIKGQDLEKRVGAFAKVGEAVTSSFAGAQAALSLFGAESEDVAKAAAQAQALLTVALSARAVAEGVVQVRTVAANIATYASAAAATAANAATRTLYTTLAANPYGAILAVIGLVVGALAAFTSNTEEAASATKVITEATSDEANKLREQLRILTQYNTLRNLQKTTLEDLKKEYPGFTAFIDKENKLTADGVRFLKAKIQQYELEAQAKALVSKIAEQQIKILELESTLSIDNLTFWQQTVNAIKSGGNVAQKAVLDLQTAYQNNREEIAKVNKTIDVYRGGLNKVYTELDRIQPDIDKFNQQLKVQADAEELAAQKAQKLKEQQEAISKAQQEGRTASISLSEEIKKLNEAFLRYEKTIQRLEKIEVSTALIDDLKKIQEARKQAAAVLVDDIAQINKELQQIATPIEDIFVDTFTKFRAANEELIKSGREGFKKLYGEEFLDFYNSQLNTVKGLSQEQKRLLADIGRGYEDFYSFLEQKGIKPFVESFPAYLAQFDLFKNTLQKTADGAYGFLLALGDIAVAAGQTKFEIDELGNVFELQFNPTATEKQAKETLDSLKKFLFEPTYFELLKLKGENILQQLVNATPEQEAKLQELLKRVKASLKSQKVDLTLIDSKEVEAQVDATIVQFQKLLGAIAQADERVIQVNKTIQELTNQIGNNADELSQAIGGVVLKNIESINKLVFNLRNKEEKEREKFIRGVVSDEEGLAKFKEKLLSAGFDVEKATYDDLLAAYIAYKTKEKEVTDESEKDKRDQQQKTYDKLQQGFQLFSTTLNQISGVFQERIQADLELLDVAQAKALENVVGESEQAAQKRLEIENEFQQKRKEIEKKGRITALRFSQVQTVANTAQAIVKALAELGPIAGPIFASIAGGIGLAQIAIIEDQISAARSLRRGGMLMSGGGMIIGPSHEQGGVPLAAMGVIAEGNESIINRQSTLDYQSLLSAVNMSGGGRPLVYNNFDDTRIVEELAKQNQKPIRAYVLGSEITNEQQLSKRLDDLSKL